MIRPGNLPLDPAITVAGSVCNLASLLGRTERTIQRTRLRGIDPYQADAIAIRLGFMPWDLWPDWWALPLEGEEQLDFDLAEVS